MSGGADATQRTVLRHLVDYGPLSRPELGDGVGLARATTSAVVNALIRRGLVAELAAVQEGRRGRPTTLLDLDDENYAVAGLEIGVDRVLSAVYTLRGRELLRTERVVESESVNPRGLLRHAQIALREALDQSANGARGLLGVGVSVPGLVDASTRRGGRADLSAAIDELVIRARSADERVVATLTCAGTWIGRGAAALSAVIDPRVIVLGGHYARLAPWLLEPARRAFAEAQLVPGDDVPALEASAGADWATAEGAALAVLKSLTEGEQALPKGPTGQTGAEVR